MESLTHYEMHSQNPVMFCINNNLLYYTLDSFIVSPLFINDKKRGRNTCRSQEGGII